MGEPGEIQWRRRGHKPRRVVLLIDVSGSMSGYADALLRLAHRMTQAGGPVETFTIGTRLTHVTRALRGRDAERALVAAGRDRARLVGRHPARRDAADVPGRAGAGAGWLAARSSWSSATAGSAATPRCSAEQMARAAPGRAPGRLGQPAPRQGRLRAGAAGRASRRCRTATTSWPGTRWRRTPSCWRWSPVRDVLAELMEWWEAGETVGVGTVVATFQSAPRPPGASMLVGPAGDAVGSVSGGCVEGAVYELAAVGRRVGRAGARAVRRLRRRRVRGRPDLRRHPRRLGREGHPRDLPRARRDRRRHRGRPPGRPRHRHRAPRPRLAGPADGRPAGPRAAAIRLASARRAPTTPCTTTRWGCWRRARTRR